MLQRTSPSCMSQTALSMERTGDIKQNKSQTDDTAVSSCCVIQANHMPTRNCCSSALHAK